MGNLSGRTHAGIFALFMAAMAAMLLTVGVGSAAANVEQHFCWTKQLGPAPSANPSYYCSEAAGAADYAFTLHAWSESTAICILQGPPNNKQKCGSAGEWITLDIRNANGEPTFTFPTIVNQSGSRSTRVKGITVAASSGGGGGGGGGEPPPPPPAVRGDLNGDRVPDLFAIALNHTGSHQTGVHVLSGGSQYQEWLLQRETPLAETSPASWQWQVGEVNGDTAPDLIGIAMNGTANHQTVVHILSGASQYQEWAIQRETPVAETSPSEWQWLAADVNHDGVTDLVGVKMNNTSGHHTDVHVLNGAGQYQEWLIQRELPIGETNPAAWQWLIGDVNGDGVPDLVGLHVMNTEDHKTDVFAYSGADQFQTLLIARATPFGETNPSQWQWAMTDENQDGIDDLVGVQSKGTSGHQTAVRVLSGATQFTTTLTQRESALGEVGLGEWQFAAAP